MTNKIVTTMLLGATLCGLSACSAAGRVHLSIDEALHSDLAYENLDPDIKLSFGKTDIQGRKIGTWVSNKKTNSVGKPVTTSCQRAFISALISLQTRARNEGGRMVSNIHSFYKQQPYWSYTDFECEEGHLMSGVALKGTVVK